MGKVGGYVAIVLLFITAIGIALETAGQFVDSEDQAKLKAKVEDFWFFVGGLSTRQIVHEAIKIRRRRMEKKYILLSIILYWLILLMVILDVLYGNFSIDIDSVRGNFEQAISTDFTGRQILIFNNIVTNIHNSCPYGYQNCHTESALLDQLAKLVTQEDSYNRLFYDLSQHRPNLLRLASTASAAFSVIAAAVPLTISLILSFNFTLFVLSLITKSNFWFLFILVSDVIVALTFPPLLLTLFLYFEAIISVSFAGPLIDYTIFGGANVFSLIIATAGVTSLLPFALSATVLLLGYVIISHISITMGAILIFNLIYHAIYGKIATFLLILGG